MLPPSTFLLAKEYFGNDLQKTMLWFQTRHYAFDMLTPLDYMRQRSMGYKYVDKYIRACIDDNKPL